VTAVAWVERPESGDLDRTAGYAHAVGVEQMGERDTVFVQLYEYYSDGSMENTRYAAYLDLGTTVALAQLQLLRDAMAYGWPVLVRYLDDTADTGSRFFYEIEVVALPMTERLFYVNDL
jgi:hypothetical protein